MVPGRVDRESNSDLAEDGAYQRSKPAVVMPIVLLLLVALVALAFCLDREVRDKDEAKDGDPPSKNLTR